MRIGIVGSRRYENKRKIKEFVFKLKKEYGTDKINIQDGTIAHDQPSSENPNPPENGEADKKD